MYQAHFINRQAIKLPERLKPWICPSYVVYSAQKYRARSCGNGSGDAEVAYSSLRMYFWSKNAKSTKEELALLRFGICNFKRAEWDQ